MLMLHIIPRLDDLLIILFHFDFRCRYVTTWSMSTSYLYVSNHGHGRAFYRLLLPPFFPSFPVSRYERACRMLFIVSVYQRDNYIPRSPLFWTNHIVAHLANFFSLSQLSFLRTITVIYEQHRESVRALATESFLRVRYARLFQLFFYILTRQEASTLTR